MQVVKINFALYPSSLFCPICGEKIIGEGVFGLLGVGGKTTCPHLLAQFYHPLNEWTVNEDLVDQIGDDTDQHFLSPILKVTLEDCAIEGMELESIDLNQDMNEVVLAMGISYSIAGPMMNLTDYFIFFWPEPEEGDA